VYGFGHQAYYEQVVRSICLGSPPPIDGASGRKSVELISAIRESIETGKEVSLRLRASRRRLAPGTS
jgi:predicted dehydrogenase